MLVNIMNAHEYNTFNSLMDRRNLSGRNVLVGRKCEWIQSNSKVALKIFVFGGWPSGCERREEAKCLSAAEAYKLILVRCIV